MKYVIPFMVYEKRKYYKLVWAKCYIEKRKNLVFAVALLGSMSWSLVTFTLD
jgi:uncharacterized membrane protein YcfT